MRKATDSESNLKPSIFAAVALAGIGLAVACWLNRPTVMLERDDYEITIALYRVCNGRNETDLLRVEELLNQSRADATEKDESFLALMAIIERAKANRWSDAMADCRKLLDDQVQR
ncbi:hypothetical protein Q31b_51800 [Novipirellula aureliae]|uniref:Uncharacterized protein n=1 Tax=Novipirellula aureliae TaxID=2527966 RepID=A0A5C6DHS3_9BACT|nr:hypothetical protein [Novipirellula aureliae]TWU35745.1 hypothetical protein Q31b_51800 [Novipirellula aureliae]